MLLKLMLQKNTYLYGWCRTLIHVDCCASSSPEWMDRELGNGAHGLGSFRRSRPQSGGRRVTLSLDSGGEASMVGMGQPDDSLGHVDDEGKLAGAGPRVVLDLGPRSSCRHMLPTLLK